jgi:biopolymer transport protein ExbD
MRLPRDEARGGTVLNMTSFIDMMFILVLFFLVTSRFQESERDETIQLARTRSTLPISTPSDTILINVDRQGRWIIDERARTIEELEEIIRARKANRPDAEVVVRADKRGIIGPLHEALEVCHRLGFKTPRIAYENAEGGGGP